MTGPAGGPDAAGTGTATLPARAPPVLEAGARDRTSGVRGRDAHRSTAGSDGAEARRSDRSAPGSRRRFSPFAQLHRRAGNTAVGTLTAAVRAAAAEPADVLGELLARSTGRPLDAVARTELSGAFDQDLAAVRIHSDPIAAAAARAIGARAFAWGDRVVMSDPALLGDRVLLGHELAHVLQARRAGADPSIDSAAATGHENAARRTGAALARPNGGYGGGIAAPLAEMATAALGPPPVIQSDDGPTGQLRVPRELDEMLASLTTAMSAGMRHTPTDMLIADAQRLHGKFESPEGPRTTAAYAQALVGIRQELLRRESSADRAPDGALLYEDIAGRHPWTAARPRSVSDIPILSQSQADKWVAAALRFATPSRDRSARSRPRSRQPAREREQTPPTESAAADARSAESPERRAMLVGSTLQEARSQVTEMETPDLIGPEIRRGLDRLRGITIGEAVEAVGRRGREVTGDSSGQGQVRTHPGPNAETSLLKATGMVYFVGNRLYVLDRTGHITGTDFHFTLQGSSLRRNGVYFFGSFALGHEGSSSATGATLLLDLTSGTPTVAAGDIYPRNVITGFAPLMQRQRQVLSANAGIGIIVSSRYAERELSLRDFSPTKVRRAVEGAVAHLPWAVRSRIRQAVQNPGQEIINQLIGLATTELIAALPPIRAPLLAYQVLQEMSWMGNLVNIAAYARTSDEINLVSQEIARRVVDEIADRILGGVVRVGRGVAGLAMGSGRGTSTRDRPDTGRATGDQTGRRETPGAAEPPPARQPAPADRPAAPPARRPTPAERPPEPTPLPPPAARQRQGGGDRGGDTGEGGRVIRFPIERARRPGQPREPAQQRRPAEVEQPAQQPSELRATGTEGAPPPSAGPPRRGPVGVVRQPPPVASAGQGGQQGGGGPPGPTRAPAPPPATGGPRRAGGGPRRGRQADAPEPRRRADEPEPRRRADEPERRRPAGSEGEPRRRTPPPEPELSNRSGSLESRVDFLVRNREHLGPRRREWVDQLRDRMRAGTLPAGERAYWERRIGAWEDAADRGLRDAFGRDLGNVVPFPVTGVGRVPRHSGGEWEQAHRAMSGETDPRLSIESRTRDGDRVQIDQYDHTRQVPREIKSARDMPDMDAVSRQRRELQDQMERQARWTRDWGMSHIEWVVHSDDVADALEGIRATLPRALRDRVRIRVENVAD